MLLGAAIAALIAAAPVQAHVPVGARGGGAIPHSASKAEMVKARQHFFGIRNVNPRTGAVRRDRVILSWFGVSNFAVAIGGKVILLDAWVPRGAHSRYVPTSPEELAALRPRFIFIGHAHFDHAADAVPLALATGARLVGTAEHCAALGSRAPITPPPCTEAVPAGAPAGTTSRVDVFRRVGVRAVKHLHSTVTGPDGYHVPVTPLPETTVVEHPPTLEDMLHLFGHLPDSEGGTVLYRFRLGPFSLVWHDSSGPLVEQSPETLAVLRDLGPVDVEVGSIQGFNQLTNGMRDPRTYIEALRPRVFVPAHHDDWAAGITTRGERYEPYLDAELKLIPVDQRPRVRFIRDPQDYVDPRVARFRVGR
jgi:L-ascorbate metabolism protein UlaG (beta-lactamase superfamily)